MVKGSNHIFFDVNNANITVNAGSGSSDTVAPTAPTLQLQELLLQAQIFHGQERQTTWQLQVMMFIRALH
jgi:hypothetical protein